jgi:hypothetical protein
VLLYKFSELRNCSCLNHQLAFDLKTSHLTFFGIVFFVGNGMAHGFLGLVQIRLTVVIIAIIKSINLGASVLDLLHICLDDIIAFCLVLFVLI